MVREKEERVAGPYKAALREEDGALIDDNDGRPTEGRAGTCKGTRMSSSTGHDTATKLTSFCLGDIEEQDKQCCRQRKDNFFHTFLLACKSV